MKIMKDWLLLKRGLCVCKTNKKNFIKTLHPPSQPAEKNQICYLIAVVAVRLDVAEEFQVVAAAVVVEEVVQPVFAVVEDLTCGP
jgi:hypothetical protein